MIVKMKRFFGRLISVFFEFIPQIIFLTFIFVYLCVMIFIKWIKFSGTPGDLTGPGCAPNLLIGILIQFFLEILSLVFNFFFT